MRIVAGRHRGKALAVPKDKRIRPTSDRVREAIFNILAHGGFAPPIEGARVLDLFAGTGALGLEALSRGAIFATFVDDHPESRALIRRNIEALHEAGRTKLLQRDASNLGPLPAGNQAGGPFDHLFLDPPYGQDLVALAITSAYGGGWLAANAVVVAEFEREIEPPGTDGLELVDRRDYGDTRVGFWRSSSGVTVAKAKA